MRRAQLDAAHDALSLRVHYATNVRAVSEGARNEEVRARVEALLLRLFVVRLEHVFMHTVTEPGERMIINDGQVFHLDEEAVESVLDFMMNDENVKKEARA